MAVGPIVDAHHHFWDIEANYVPWLCDEPAIPFRYGDYTAIRRNYMPADYLKDARSQIKLFNVDGSFVREVELPGIGTASGFGGERNILGSRRLLPVRSLQDS